MSRAELWSITSKERQLLGRCIENLVITNCESSQKKIGKTEVTFYNYTLKKHDNARIESFSIFNLEEKITMSEQIQNFSAATCSILTLSDEFITVQSSVKFKQNTTRIRIDKEDYISNSSLLIQSLTDLFINPNSRKLFTLIVQLEIPTFSCIPMAINSDPELNSDQLCAIRRCVQGTHNY